MSILPRDRSQHRRWLVTLALPIAGLAGFAVACTDQIVEPALSPDAGARLSYSGTHHPTLSSADVQPYAIKHDARGPRRVWFTIKNNAPQYRSYWVTLSDSTDRITPGRAEGTGFVADTVRQVHVGPGREVRFPVDFTVAAGGANGEENVLIVRAVDNQGAGYGASTARLRLRVRNGGPYAKLSPGFVTGSAGETVRVPMTLGNDSVAGMVCWLWRDDGGFGGQTTIPSATSGCIHLSQGAQVDTASRVTFKGSASAGRGDWQGLQVYYHSNSEARTTLALTTETAGMPASAVPGAIVDEATPLTGAPGEAKTVALRLINLEATTKSICYTWRHDVGTRRVVAVPALARGAGECVQVSANSSVAVKSGIAFLGSAVPNTNDYAGFQAYYLDNSNYRTSVDVPVQASARVARPNRFYAYTGYTASNDGISADTSNIGNRYGLAMKPSDNWHGQDRQFIGVQDDWTLMRATLDERFPLIARGSMWMISDEPDQRRLAWNDTVNWMTPAKYAQQYFDAVGEILSRDSTARFASATFAQTVHNGNPNPAGHDTIFAAAFLAEYRKLAQSGSTWIQYCRRNGVKSLCLDEWAFQAYAKSNGSAGGIEWWTGFVNGLASWSQRNGAPAFIAFGFPWLDHANSTDQAYVLANMPTMVNQIRGDCRIAGAAWWNYDVPGSSTDSKFRITQRASISDNNWALTPWGQLYLDLVRQPNPCPRN